MASDYAAIRAKEQKENYSEIFIFTDDGEEYKCVIRGKASSGGVLHLNPEESFVSLPISLDKEDSVSIRKSDIKKIVVNIHNFLDVMNEIGTEDSL